VQKTAERAIYDKEFDMKNCSNNFFDYSDPVTVYFQTHESLVLESKGVCYDRVLLRESFVSQQQDVGANEMDYIFCLLVYDVPVWISSGVAQAVLGSQTRNITITTQSIVIREHKVLTKHILGKINRCMEYCSKHVTEWIGGFVDFLLDMENTQNMERTLFELSYDHKIYVKIQDDTALTRNQLFVIRRTRNEQPVIKQIQPRQCAITSAEFRKMILESVGDSNNQKQTVSVFFSPIKGLDRERRLRFNHLTFTLSEIENSEIAASKDIYEETKEYRRGYVQGLEDMQVVYKYVLHLDSMSDQFDG